MYKLKFNVDGKINYITLEDRIIYTMDKILRYRMFKKIGEDEYTLSGVLFIKGKKIFFSLPNALNNFNFIDSNLLEIDKNIDKELFLFLHKELLKEKEKLFIIDNKKSYLIFKIGEENIFDLGFTKYYNGKIKSIDSLFSSI